MGYKNHLPWDLKEDMRHFARATKSASPGRRNAVIMGRKTWESLGNRVLPGRTNIVVSSSATSAGATVSSTNQDGPFFVGSFTGALAILDKQIETAFVIGGARLFAEALTHPECSCAYITEVNLQPPPVCDVFFPLQELLAAFECVEERNAPECVFRTYRRFRD